MITINRLWIRLTIAFVIVTQLSIFVVAGLANSSINGEFRRYVVSRDITMPITAPDQSFFVFQQTAAQPAVPGAGSDHGKTTDLSGAPMTLPPLVADAKGNIIYDPRQARVGMVLSSDELAVALPIGQQASSGTPEGYLLPSLPTGGIDILFQSPEQEFLSRLRNTLLLASLLVGGIGMLIGLIISRTMVAPLGSLAKAARAFAAHDWSQRVAARGANEIADVAHAFNEMADEIQRSETLRRNMMTDIAHELRTPLTVMQGNLRALLDGIYVLDKREVAILYENTCMLNRLVDDLRELARADAGQVIMNLQKVDLAVMLEAAVSNFAIAAESQNVQLTVQDCENMPLVQADAARLTQILGNLLANALRHTPAGNITIAATRTNNQRRDEVCISVTDTGEGITEADLPYIFDRLYRADKSRSRSSGNSGLGLTIAKAWVEAMQGRIGVESAHGQGSRFWFTLPVHG